MSRPKRTKVVTTRTAARTTQNSGGKKTSSGDLLSGSGATRKKTERKKDQNQKSQEASSGLNAKHDSHENRRITSDVDEQELSEVARQRTALDDDLTLTKNGNANIMRRDTDQSVESFANNSSVGMQRRVSTRSKMSRTSLDAEKAAETEDAQQANEHEDERTTEAQPGSALGLHAIPSRLSLANFKRRPRQPSILRMVQQSLANDDTTILNVTSIEREGEELEDNSILAALQHSSPGSKQVDSPESSLTPVPSSSASRKRKALVLDEPTVSLQSEHLSESEHLPSDPADLPAPISSSPPAAARLSRNDPQVDTTPKTRPSTRSINQRTPPNPRKRTSLRKQISSSPIAATSPISSPGPPTAKQLAPETQAQQPSKKPKTTHITTAALQAFLPRRRQPPRAKQRDAFDIPSDDTPISSDTPAQDEEVDDMDELSRPARRRAKPKKTAPNPPPSTASKKAAPKSRKATAKPLSNTTNANAKTTVPSKSKAKRTYGSDKNDKENAAQDDDVDGVGSAGEDAHDENEDENAGTVHVAGAAAGRKAPKSRELVEAKEKFKEVDEWELEFESGDMVGGSSSPWR